MYQEIEGNRPVVVTRNHNARIRPNVYRWNQQADYMSAWTTQRSLMCGALGGFLSATLHQIWKPVTDILHFYQAPDSMRTLSIFVNEVMKSESLRTGYLGNLAFHMLYGVTFNSARLWLWHNIAGGYAYHDQCVSVNWPKHAITAMFVGAATCWIPVPFHNIERRMAQDAIMPKDVRRGYSNPFTAAAQIAAKDGFYPFIRSAGPLMGENFMNTFCLFFLTEFWYDKYNILLDYGYRMDGAGMPVNWVRFISLFTGVFSAQFFSYPLRTLRAMVEGHPLNSKGERLFNTYAEAFWKFNSDQYNIAHNWTGFSRYFAKTGPPMLAMMWLADVYGLVQLTKMDIVWVDSN